MQRHVLESDYRGLTNAFWLQNRSQIGVKWSLMGIIVTCAICLMVFHRKYLASYDVEFFYIYRRESLWITLGQGWKHTRTNCESGTRRYWLAMSSFHYLYDLQVSDSGIYLCKGVNGFGSAQAQLELLVSGFPTLTSFWLGVAFLFMLCPNASDF